MGAERRKPAPDEPERAFFYRRRNPKAQHRSFCWRREYDLARPRMGSRRWTSEPVHSHVGMPSAQPSDGIPAPLAPHFQRDDVIYKGLLALKPRRISERLGLDRQIGNRRVDPRLGRLGRAARRSKGGAAQG